MLNVEERFMIKDLYDRGWSVSEVIAGERP